MGGIDLSCLRDFKKIKDNLINNYIVLLQEISFQVVFFSTWSLGDI
jgi:hypothetical protein